MNLIPHFRLVSLRGVLDGACYLASKPGATAAAAVPLLPGEPRAACDLFHLSGVSVGPEGELVEDRSIGGTLRIVVLFPAAVVEVAPLLASASPKRFSSTSVFESG